MFDIDTFVNSNTQNVDLHARYKTLIDAHVQLGNNVYELLDAAMLVFIVENALGDCVDNDDADVVHVYLRDDVAVAWYDWENAHGYVAA